MIETSGTFTSWACDPGRTLEERYGALLLIEATHNQWRKKHGIQVDFNFDYQIQRNKARLLDPGYTPAYGSSDTGHVDEILAELKTLRISLHADRPLRDVSFLRFCTALEDLHFHGTEVADWSPLGSLTNLTRLHLWENKFRDFRVIGGLATLQVLHLYLFTPWPDLRGLERLSKLTTLHFNGNLLTLQKIPSLPAVRQAHLGKNHTCGLPLRDLTGLPDMPELRRLKLEATTELEGIQRYENLVNLEVHGLYTDLTPLSGLHELTHLTLHDGEYPGLAPLAPLPKLRKISLHIEFPPDLTPLAEIPHLHEIKLESPVIPVELETLNSLCASWNEEFECRPARPLAPVRLRQHLANGIPKNDGTAIPRDWGDDEEMAKSEIHWFARKFHRHLKRLLGKGWGKRDRDILSGAPGHLMVTISRSEDIDRLPQIVATFRQLLASTLHPWTCMLVVNSMAQYERPIEEIQYDPDTYDPEQERRDWEEFYQNRRERRDFLQRKYRQQLSEETGVPVPDAPTAKAPEEYQDDDDYEESEIPDNEYDLGTQLHFHATLTENAIYVDPKNRNLVEMLFEMKLEDP